MKPRDWWPTRYPRLWPFLNSTFGLWLLSSVVVGGLGFVYTQNQNKQAEKLKKLEIAQAEATKTAAHIERLDLEIGYRLSSTISRLAELHAATNRCDATQTANSHCKPVKMQLDEMFLARHQPPSMFPDFSSYSTLALVAELKRAAPPQEKSELDKVIYHMTGLFDMLKVNGAPLENPEAVAGQILDKLRLPRWAKGFYYLDCDKARPFC